MIDAERYERRARLLEARAALASEILQGFHDWATSGRDEYRHYVLEERARLAAGVLEGAAWMPEPNRAARSRGERMLERALNVPVAV